jgi:hypothetical protein
MSEAEGVCDAADFAAGGVGAFEGLSWAATVMAKIRVSRKSARLIHSDYNFARRYGSVPEENRVEWYQVGTVLVLPKCRETLYHGGHRGSQGKSENLTTQRPQRKAAESAEEIKGVELQWTQRA